ncbi:PREDICTED: probable purine permease 9 [Nicotiana attenuata]|uniref:probable purine permease 9 n=1 Tax=Nicotiana attenuata TaxID=49451 RepID=UPI0009056481|nr:PREDICTED: probable purine permease 9 [Nicotiana attenuata]
MHSSSGISSTLSKFQGQEAEDIEPICEKTETYPCPDSSYKFKLWLQISIFIFLVLSGQIVVTLLGKVYYNYGGKSKWIATLVPFAGLFASGYWRNLEKEMEEFELGKASYIVYLSLGTIYSQAQTLGSIGLIFKYEWFKVSFIGFSLLGLWGFTSYLYQQYLDSSLLANAVEIRTSDHDVDEVESHF